MGLTLQIDQISDLSLFGSNFQNLHEKQKYLRLILNLFDYDSTGVYLVLFPCPAVEENNLLFNFFIQCVIF